MTQTSSLTMIWWICSAQTRMWLNILHTNLQAIRRKEHCLLNLYKESIYRMMIQNYDENSNTVKPVCKICQCTRPNYSDLWTSVTLQACQDQMLYFGGLISIMVAYLFQSLHVEHMEMASNTYQPLLQWTPDHGRCWIRFRKNKRILTSSCIQTQTIKMRVIVPPTPTHPL